MKILDADKTPEILGRATELALLVNKIDNLPLSDIERARYYKDIANIYQIGFVSNVDIAKDYANSLKEEIERNLIIRKKQVLFLPVVIFFILIIIGMYILGKFSIVGDIKYPIIYGSLGGLLSVIYQNNKLEIDYNVVDKFLYFEAFKLILLSNILSIIGSIAIKSEFILGNITNMDGGIYISFLIYIICGYSQTFIPNILRNFEIKNTADS